MRVRGRISRADAMKKSPKVHALWLTVAVAAFGVGAQFPAGSHQGAANGAGRGGDTQPGQESTAGGVAVAASSDREPGSGRTDAASTKKAASLSDDRIAALGEKFRSSNNPIEKRLSFSKLLEGLTAENALLVREQIEHMDHHSAEFREFHYAWGAVGGADAALFGIDTEEDDMMPALAGWASADPSAAMTWVQTLDMANDPRFDPLLVDRKLEAEGLKNHLMRGLVQGLADTDPEAATAFLLSAAENGEKAAYHGMMHMVVEARLRDASPEEAAAWASSLEDEHLRGQAIDRVADRFARGDLEAAKTWASGLGDDAGGAAAVAQVGAHLARRDPQAAVAWLGELPAGDGQNRGMHRAMGEWTGRDPGAASRHLVEMPASDAKDAAISGFSRRIAWDDPEAAVAWAATIGSEEHRHGALVGAGRTWVRRDRQSASDWLASSSLPAEIQQAILNPPQKRKRDDG